MSNKGMYAMTTFQKGYQSNEMTANVPMQSSQLMKLFEDELRDIYWVEKALLHATPKMIKNATSQELIETLTQHVVEIENQINRVEMVFKFIKKRPSVKRCLAMEGQLKEVGDMMASCDPGAMCDAGIISAGRKVEHYEIAAYETLIGFAESLGHEDVMELFEVTLAELEASVEKFAGVSDSTILVQENAEEADEEMEEEYDQSYHLNLI